MLLLFLQGVAGTATVGVSDTASLTVSEDPTSDFFLQTLDTASLSVSDVSAPAIQINVSDFPLVAVGESAGLTISGVVSVAVTDTASLTVSDASALAVDINVTDTTSLSVSDASTVDIGQIAVAVTDTISIGIADFAFSSTVADVSRVSGDDINLLIDERAIVVSSKPAFAIRFTGQPDQICFTSP